MSRVAMENGKTLEKNRYRVGRTYKILAALRIILAIVPQTGYIHPDEFFQSMEIMIGSIFEAERSPIPDYDSSDPYRNIVVPYIFYGPLLALCKWLLTYFNYRGTVSPYLLLIPCRLLMCSLSFLVDYSLVSICRKYGTNVEPRLTLLASSYVMLVFGSRTFSNMIETALFSLLLNIVVNESLDAEKAYPREMKLKASLEVVQDPRQRVLLTRQLKELSHPEYSGSFKIAVICVVGTFCRPTFAAFAIIPVWFWLYRGSSVKYLSMYSLHLRGVSIAWYAAAITSAMVFLDTAYYKPGKWIDMISNHGAKECLLRVTECFVITPWNFFRFNVNDENQIPHGIHPRWLNVVNLFLLYNVLAYCFFYVVASVTFGIVRARNVVKFDSVTGMMFSAVILPLIVLSVVPHQEPRYIIPITLPLVFLCGPMIYGDSTSEKRQTVGNRVFFAWCVINAFCFCFYGFLHQGGVLPALKYLTTVRNDLQSPDIRMHVLSSHIYTLPLTFLTNTINGDENESRHGSKRSKKVIMYPTTSTSFDVRVVELATVVNHVKKNPPHNDLIYFVFPTSLTRNFTSAIAAKKLECRYAVEFYAYSHVSTEAMPKIDRALSDIGLNVVRLKPGKRRKNNAEEAGYFDAGSNPSDEELYAHSVRVFLR